MTKVATYTNNDEFCDPEFRNVAYIVLPNGKYWGVMFHGATEEIARAKAIALWESEKKKQASMADKWNNNPIEHHLSGLVWMIHKETREKKRVKLTEITMYEQWGYTRGGPRSK